MSTYLHVMYVLICSICGTHVIYVYKLWTNIDTSHHMTSIQRYPDFKGSVIQLQMCIYIVTVWKLYL